MTHRDTSAPVPDALGRPSVRLPQQDLRSLHDTFADLLPESAEVFVFGSRADLSRRGGDIDLLVHVPGIPVDTAYGLRQCLAVRLMDRLGERKIDIVVTPSVDESASAFVRLAVLDGVKIWP